MRLALLDKVKIALEKVTVANGYSITIERVDKVYRDEQTEHSIRAYVALGETSRDFGGESDELMRNETSIFIVIYNKTSEDVDNTGTLIDKSELCISNVIKCFEGSDDIDSQYTFNPGIAGVQSWHISNIEPYIDDKSGRSAVVLEGVITYYTHG